MFTFELAVVFLGRFGRIPTHNQVIYFHSCHPLCLLCDGCPYQHEPCLFSGSSWTHLPDGKVTPEFGRTVAELQRKYRES